MNAAIFFVAPRQGDANLVDVARAVFQALALVEYEERGSSNYPPDDHYFAGYGENAEVMVFDADDDRTSEYPFRVSVEAPSSRRGPGVVETDVGSFARALVAAGCNVFVPTGAWWRTDWDGSGDVYAA